MRQTPVAGRHHLRSHRAHELCQPRDRREDGTAVFRMVLRNETEGKSCLTYVLAAAWLDGAVTIESFSDESYRRIRDSGLFDRVVIRFDPQLAHGRGKSLALVKVLLTDGTRRISVSL